MALNRWRVTPVASLMAAEMMLPPTLSSRPSCSGAILPHTRYAAGSRSSAQRAQLFLGQERKWLAFLTSLGF